MISNCSNEGDGHLGEGMDTATTKDVLRRWHDSLALRPCSIPHCALEGKRIYKPNAFRFPSGPPVRPQASWD
jgi:hypothetical protein